ncbi:MAG: hypothetical protein EBY52_09440, partial [Actinobacteria bacterium]|nr:hypothetical protein [Actinomycetota bacterium]
MRERSPLPDGTPAIALGLAINGISTYGFLVLARRAVGDEAYGGLAIVWSLVYILGPGLFQPLEQEVARATAARGSLGQGSAPVLRQAANIGAIFLALVFTGVLVAWPLGLSGMLVLLATSISEAFLLNVGPVALAIIGDELGEEAPGVFLNGLIISRIPLFFFQAVKASLLPALAARAADDDLDGFREVQLRLVGAVAVVAAGSTAAIALVGPWVVETA